MTQIHPPTSSHSILQRLRSVVPTREGVLFEESLRLAELQAALLNEVLAGPEGVRDVEIAGLPRIAIYYEPLSVSGMSHWNGREWIIAIASDDSLVRQRFTLLHEFKHILDHGSASRLYHEDRWHTASEAAERAADYFAGCVLIPRRELKAAWGNGIQRVEDLAVHFGASEDAVVVRLAQTGLSRATDLRVRRARCARSTYGSAKHSRRPSRTRSTVRRGQL